MADIIEGSRVFFTDGGPIYVCIGYVEGNFYFQDENGITPDIIVKSEEEINQLLMSNYESAPAEPAEDVAADEDDGNATANEDHLLLVPPDVSVLPRPTDTSTQPCTSSSSPVVASAVIQPPADTSDRCTTSPDDVDPHGSAAIWSKGKTLLLLDLCTQYKGDLQDPSKKKKNIWIKIANEMKSKGSTVTWIACEKKMRNLKQTYKNIKDNNSKTGRGLKTWELFDVMDKLFAKDAAISCNNVQETTEGIRFEGHGGGCEEGSDEGDGCQEKVANLSAQSGDKKRRKVQSAKPEAIAELKAIEERKIKSLEMLTDAVVKSNKEKTDAILQMNETMKKLIEKL